MIGVQPVSRCVRPRAAGWRWVENEVWRGREPLTRSTPQGGVGRARRRGLHGMYLNRKQESRKCYTTVTIVALHCEPG